MQRIESGRLGGRRLRPLPKGVNGLRPTAARVRGAIFDRLHTAVEGARVLDLFAGSGALSFEALSRGADHATMLEVDGRVVRYLEHQARELGVREQVAIMRTDALTTLERGGPKRGFDLVLIDPPFATPEVIEPIGSALTGGWLVPGAYVVCERERVRGKSLPVAWPAVLHLETAKVYGQAEVEFLRYQPPSSDL